MQDQKILLWNKIKTAKKETKVALQSLILFICLLIAVHLGDTAIAVNSTYGDRELPIYSVKTDKKKISISFDAAWGAEDFPKIIAILDKHNVKTTFFMTGEWVEKYPIVSIEDGLGERDWDGWKKLTKEARIQNLQKKKSYQLSLTNKEVMLMFEEMVFDWFHTEDDEYNAFITALLKGNVKEMNAYMNEVALATFSSFDTGKHPSKKLQPERFYHGFVLGLLVELRGRYEVLSNGESGYGRYDVMLCPLKENEPAIVLEFKVHDAEEEKTL